MSKVTFASLKKAAGEYETIAINTLGIYFQAHQFVKTYSFKRYLLFSGLAFLLFFSMTIKVILFGIDYIQIPITNAVLPFVQRVVTFSAEDISKGFKAIFWLIKKAVETNKDALFSGIFLVLGTPYFSFISSKTEEFATGRVYSFQWLAFFKEIKRGITLSFKNTVRQVTLIIFITLLGLVPVISVSTPLLTFLVQAYYNGILMTDYTLERHGYSIRESETFYKCHKPEMFGIGLGFMFILLIPVLGWFAAPTYSLVASYLQFSKINISKDSTGAGGVL
jgi:CysZ protein